MKIKQQARHKDRWVSECGKYTFLPSFSGYTFFRTEEGKPLYVSAGHKDLEAAQQAAEEHEKEQG